MKIETVLVDLDGVIVKFFEAACKELGFSEEQTKWHLNNWKVRNHSISEQVGISDNEFWKRINRNADFWHNLEEYDYAQSFIADLRNKYDTYFCTAPNSDPKCCAAKMQWIKTHFPDMRRKYQLTPCKFLGANEGTVLIDDSDEKCNAFRTYKNRGGRAHVFSQPWNSNFLHWKNNVEYCKQELEKMNSEN